MHPIERLRYLARSAGHNPQTSDFAIAREFVMGIGPFLDEPAALLVACRQVLCRHPENALLVWLSAIALADTNSASQLWEALEALEEDPVVGYLEEALPVGASLAVVGDWSSLHRPPLERPDVTWHMIGETGRDVALATLEQVDLVMVMAWASGPDRFVARQGCGRIVERANCLKLPIWVVSPLGTVLSRAMFTGFLRRLAPTDRAGASLRVHEEVPWTMTSSVISPQGPLEAPAQVPATLCPDVPELF